MSARINGYTLTTMEGEIPSYTNRVETRERAGVDGYTHIRMGKRSEPFQLRTSTLAADLATARSLARDYESLGGTFLTIDTTDGRHYGTVMCHRIETTCRPVLQSSSGDAALVVATWQLQRGS